MSLKQILLESKMASLDNNDVEVYKMIDKEAGGDAVDNPGSNQSSKLHW